MKTAGKNVFRKQNCIFSNCIYFLIIWKIWFQQEIKQRFHLYNGHCAKLQTDKLLMRCHTYYYKLVLLQLHNLLAPGKSPPTHNSWSYWCLCTYYTNVAVTKEQFLQLFCEMFPLCKASHLPHYEDMLHFGGMWGWLVTFYPRPISQKSKSQPWQRLQFKEFHSTMVWGEADRYLTFNTLSQPWRLVMSGWLGKVGLPSRCWGGTGKYCHIHAQQGGMQVWCAEIHPHLRD